MDYWSYPICFLFFRMSYPISKAREDKPKGPSKFQWFSSKENLSRNSRGKFSLAINGRAKKETEEKNPLTEMIVTN